MPVYPGRRSERAEVELRAEIGAKPRDVAPVQLGPGDASELIWIGGHAVSFVYFVQVGKSGPTAALLALTRELAATVKPKESR